MAKCLDLITLSLWVLLNEPMSLYSRTSKHVIHDILNGAKIIFILFNYKRWKKYFVDNSMGCYTYNRKQNPTFSKIITTPVSIKSFRGCFDISIGQADNASFVDGMRNYLPETRFEWKQKRILLTVAHLRCIAYGYWNDLSFDLRIFPCTSNASLLYLWYWFKISSKII